MRSIDRLLAMNHEIATGVRPRLAATYEGRVSFWEVKTEAHFCVASVRHLDLALALLESTSGYVLPSYTDEMRYHTRILRNAFEHWDEPEGRSRRELNELVGMDAANRYGFSQWTKNELRHPAVSLRSDAGVPLEQIAEIVGHSTSRRAGEAYRHRLSESVSVAVAPMEALLGRKAVEAGEAGGQPNRRTHRAQARTGAGPGLAWALQGGGEGI